MKKILFVCLYIMFATRFMQAQNDAIWIKGSIKDAKNKQGIEFVAIGILGTYISTLSKQDGTFELMVPLKYTQDSAQLVFSAASYLPAHFSLAGKTKNQLIDVDLVPKENELSTIPIVGLTAKSFLKKTIDELGNTYYQKPFIQNCFYQQTHKENGVYVRLIEAFVDLYHPSFYQTNTKILRERLCVKALHRSMVFERNGETHGDHIVDLLLENFLIYTAGGPLNKRNLNYFDCHYADNADTNLYAISFSSVASSHDKRLKGIIYISKSDYSIREINCYKYPAPLQEDANWKFINAHLQIIFKKENGKSVLDRIALVYNHDVRNKVNGNYQWTVEECFELSVLANQYTGIDAALAADTYSDLTNLYEKKYHESDFKKLQKQYGYVLAYSMVLRQDLEMPLGAEKYGHSLEEQFKMNEE